MKFGDFVKVKSLESPQGFRENLGRQSGTDFSLAAGPAQTKVYATEGWRFRT